MLAAVAKRKVVAIRRKRLPGGRYLQLYVLEGRGPRGGKTVGYVQSRKGAPASSSAPAAGRMAPAPSPKPAVIVKRKRHGGSAVRRRGR
jgi:hypothetical protein